MTVEPYKSAVLTVTFDTNTLDSVVCPETAQRGTERSGAVVRAAIRAGRIEGFFSETVITVEGIRGVERSEVLGKTRVFAEVTSSGERQRGPSTTFQLGVGMHHVRPPLDAQMSARVQGAFELGIRPLMTAARMGGYHLKPEVHPLFEPPGGMPELLRRMDDVNDMTTAIVSRGVGQAIAVELGKRFSERDGVEEPELWLQGLGRARDKSERKKVAKATREWSDGDSIAAHYGFGIQLFCTEDRGRSGRSVLDRTNRKWLTEEYGIEFVTLAELAERVTE